MTRTVSADLQVAANAECQIELQIAVARTPGLEVDEELTIVHDRGVLEPVEVPTTDHGRFHLLTLPPGRTNITYRATVSGLAEPAPAHPRDLSVYRRPSRYATSDTFGGFAQSEFGDVETKDLLATIAAWVGTRLEYVPGSSGPTDGASETMLRGEGVCRDYAHLVITLCRALGYPARLVAVYAPGCDPMDFHAVAEVFIGGGWHIADATALAPRASIVRIATGRDAADTAFMSTIRGHVFLRSCFVGAVADEGLPDDDLFTPVTLR